MRLILLAAMAGLIAGAAQAQTPVVPGYGAVTPLPAAHEQPEPAREYKVVFDVAKGAPAPGRPSAGLDRVARFANMLAEGGVPADKRRIVAVLHGPATEAVMTDEAYGRRHDGAKNPNAPLVAQLEAAGVDVRVCGQAMSALKIAPADLLPGVQVDLAALMTVVHKQLDGYVLVMN